MLRYLTAGESHGEALIGIVEGMPSGIPIVARDINHELARRWLGFGRGGRAKIEQDKVHIYSGVRFSRTIGSPIAMRLENAAYHKDKASWPRVMAVEGSGEGVDKITLPRPGHADLVGVQKYRFDDIRPVIDRSSARETAMRVACCSLARVLLRQFGIEVGSHVLHIGDGTDSVSRSAPDLSQGAEAMSALADRNPVRMLDDASTETCIERIKAAKEAGDTLGGAYEVVVTGLPPGLGSYVHWDRRLDGLLGQAVLSIPGQKAVEIGDGVAGTYRPGSRVHDAIVSQDEHDSRSSNNAGGIEGGVSNGMPIVVRGYMKPIPTMIRPIQTVDIRTGVSQPTRYERSDVTSVPAASVVAEASVAFTIANVFLEKYGGDSLDEILERYPATGTG
jgi:chorismate synthase